MIFTTHQNPIPLRLLTYSAHTRKRLVWLLALKSGTPSGKMDDGLSADRLLFLGYQGMDKADAAKFARSNFVTYVKNGRTAFG
ncbi:MAG: hypothetical protein R2875_16510 [Desulfobacterales bacterium]